MLEGMPFIVFEGLDGSGKSTLIAGLSEELKRRNQQVLVTREPGGTPLGDEIRELILRTKGEAPGPRAELLLYEASRAQHVDKVIWPALKKGQWVLCDRFTASSIAFQAGGRELSVEWVRRLNDFATHGLKPDLSILLDLSVEESRARRLGRPSRGPEPKEDRIESEADQFHERVRKAFLQQAQEAPEDWLVLDARQAVLGSLQAVLNLLEKNLWLES